MRKYGFYGGCFNPPTLAHIELAKKAIQEYKLDKIFFVPVGKHYKKPNLASEMQRLEMLKLATKNCKNIKILDMELNQSKGFSANEIFNKIEQEFNKSENYFIMGADNFLNLEKWKDAEQLIKNFKYIILERQGYDINNIISKSILLKKHSENFNILKNQQIIISSTIVRNLIQEQKYEELEKYICKDVKEYIIENTKNATIA